MFSKGRAATVFGLCAGIGAEIFSASTDLPLRADRFSTIAALCPRPQPGIGCRFIAEVPALAMLAFFQNMRVLTCDIALFLHACVAHCQHAVCSICAMKLIGHCVHDDFKFSRFVMAATFELRLGAFEIAMRLLALLLIVQSHFRE